MFFLENFKQTNENLENQIFEKESSFSNLNELIQLSKLEHNKNKLKDCNLSFFLCYIFFLL